MQNFIINPESISQVQIEANFLSYLMSSPDFQQYKNYFRGEAGSILLKLLSGFSTYNTYKSVASTSNNYLNYVNDRVSAIGIGSNTGYNTYRGRNQIVSLRVVPDRNILLTKYEIMGTVSGVDISPIENYTLIQNQPQTIRCVIGDVLESTLKYPNTKLNLMVFVEPKVSQDIKLLLNEVEVPFSLETKDMLKDYYHLRSNAFGGVDVYYLNYNIPGATPLYPYVANDDLKIVYVKLQNLTYNFPGDIEFNFGVIDDESPDTSILVNYRNPESKESIQINAPISYELQNTIKAREDYPKFLKILNSDLIDTIGRDVALPVIYLDQKIMIPAFTEISYVKRDFTLFEAFEINSLTDKVTAEGSRPHGIPKCYITHPKRVDVQLDLNLTQKAKTDSNTINIDIGNIFNYYFDDRGVKKLRGGKLFYNLDLKDIEFDVERLKYIQIARADIHTKTWSSLTNYKRGDFIVPTTYNGKMYEIVSDTYQYNPATNTNDNIGAYSGLNEPNWSLIDNELHYENISAWLPDTPYSEGTYVLNGLDNAVVYLAKKTGQSNIVPPDWGYIMNELIEDNGIVWKVIQHNDFKQNLVYRTHNLNQYTFKPAWNEYYILNYGPEIIWQ